MKNPDKKKKKVKKLASDQEYLKAFLDTSQSPGKKNRSQDRQPQAPKDQEENTRNNRHGLPVIDTYEDAFLSDVKSAEAQDIQAAGDESTPNSGDEIAEPPEEDFGQLLDEYFKDRRLPAKETRPMPLKRRLKRFPPPEADIDLHGFTAVKAQIKARSFVLSGLNQGFHTLRIIVGRGLHSQEGPVLPDVIEDLLKEMKAQKLVLSFNWERGLKKNSGAVIVYLNRFDE